MNITQSSKWLFVTTGVYAALCAPAILLAERLAWPQTLFHVTQFLAVALCLPASLLFLWRTRGSASGAQQSLAVVAAVLSGLWLSFVVFVLLTLDFSAMDR
jgi:hypothetical protein